MYMDACGKRKHGWSGEVRIRVQREMQHVSYVVALHLFRYRISDAYLFFFRSAAWLLRLSRYTPSPAGENDLSCFVFLFRSLVFLSCLIFSPPTRSSSGYLALLFSTRISHRIRWFARVFNFLEMCILPKFMIFLDFRKQ